MHGSRNFRRGGGGGGGGPGQTDKKSSDNVLFFLIYLFFLSSAYFIEVKWSISKKSIIFKVTEGVQHFPGVVQLFPGGWGGVKLLIPYRNPYNL